MRVMVDIIENLPLPEPAVAADSHLTRADSAQREANRSQSFSCIYEEWLISALGYGSH